MNKYISKVSTIEEEVSFFKEYGSEISYYLIAKIGVLTIWPLLYFDNNDEEYGEVIRSAVDTSAFRVWVYLSLSVTIPLAFELINDVLSNKRWLMKQIFYRYYICEILLFVSVLNIRYSLHSKTNPKAAVIKDMTDILTVSVIMNYLTIRDYKMSHRKYFRPIFIAFTVGTTIKSYGRGSSVILASIGLFFQFIGVLFQWFVVILRIFMVLQESKGMDWYEKRRRINFEVLLLLMYACVIVISASYGSFKDRDFVKESVAPLGFCSTCFYVLMSSVITNEYRYEYEELQRKLSVKRMFVRYVSHEVRTPLNSFMLGVNCVKDSLLNPTESSMDELRTILDEVAEGCNTAVDFMNNLLLYEKVDSMDLPVHPQRENLCVVCAQVLNSFQMSARQLEIKLKLDIHSSLECTLSGTVIPASDEVHPSFVAYSNIDVAKVVIVLRNILSNSLKFTPKGGIVSLSVTPVNLEKKCDAALHESSQHADKVILPSSLPQDTTHYRVVISDTGRGMTQDEQQLLFTKIVQFSPNEIQQGGGSGIGLYLSHHIMVSHNMKIQVFSKGVKGCGSHFYMDFPVFQEGDIDMKVTGKEEVVEIQPSRSLCPCFQSVKIAQMATSDSVMEGSQHDVALSSDSNVPKIFSQQSTIISEYSHLRVPLNEMRILVVDDCALNRKMVTRTLKQHNIGAIIENACDGLEVLDILGVPEEPEYVTQGDIENRIRRSSSTSSPYDVIILDENMTYMNGSVAVSKLREHGYKGLVVGLTGSAREEDMQYFCDSGVDYVLPKPFDVGNFVDLIQNDTSN